MGEKQKRQEVESEAVGLGRERGKVKMPWPDAQKTIFQAEGICI